MEMLQQLLMATFAACVFSILIFDRLSLITAYVDEHKLNGAIGRSTESKKKSKSKKKVRFAVHDQIAIIVNNKIVKLDSTKLTDNKQFFVHMNYDLTEVYVGSNWIGEELMICKEVGFCAEARELGFDDCNHGGASRKLKETVKDDYKVGNAGDINLLDYHRNDPVPSSKASINHGPIQHGTPLMPYIPNPPPLGPNQPNHVDVVFP
ncbi:hypothetical protein L6452_39196 [Arctium lappa]|uniref:Uncharacterized protein n=1 Tax=Arctium lappa TaxID=4217 RepID=A0ACB8XRN1_ARCLA|nr:hypothetical protein L6452_39196 [Arctium lappa]